MGEGNISAVCRQNKSWVAKKGKSKLRNAKALLLAMSCDRKAAAIFVDMIKNKNALQKSGLGGGVGPKARAAIAIIKEGLVVLGYIKLDKAKSDIYDTNMQKAVDKFQKDDSNGKIIDGKNGTKFGRGSFAKLVSALKARTVLARR